MVRTDAAKRKLLKELNETPIIEVACKNAAVPRSTYYRWLKEDEEFEEAAIAAINVSSSRISDLAVSQLISLIKDKDFKSITYWLTRRHPEFAAQPMKTQQHRGAIDPIAAVLRSYGLLSKKKDGTKHNRFMR